MAFPLPTLIIVPDSAPVPFTIVPEIEVVPSQVGRLSNFLQTIPSNRYPTAEEMDAVIALDNLANPTDQSMDSAAAEFFASSHVLDWLPQPPVVEEHFIEAPNMSAVRLPSSVADYQFQPTDFPFMNVNKFDELQTNFSLARTPFGPEFPGHFYLIQNLSQLTLRAQFERLVFPFQFLMLISFVLLVAADSAGAIPLLQGFAQSVVMSAQYQYEQIFLGILSLRDFELPPQYTYNKISYDSYLGRNIIESGVFEATWSFWARQALRVLGCAVLYYGMTRNTTFRLWVLFIPLYIYRNRYYIFHPFEFYLEWTWGPIRDVRSEIQRLADKYACDPEVLSFAFVRTAFVDKSMYDQKSFAITISQKCNRLEFSEIDTAVQTSAVMSALTERNPIEDVMNRLTFRKLRWQWVGDALAKGKIFAGELPPH